jgi:hypothetical protein
VIGHWVSCVFLKLTSKKTCRKEKKGRRGGETNANRAGTGDAGAAITARTSNALKAFCYQRCTCRSKKKQENERSRSEDETWIHHGTDTDYIIKQTPPLCSSDAYANLFERQFFSLCFLPFAHRTRKNKFGKKNWRSNKLCFLPFAHRTRRRQCAAALRGCASFRCFPHPFSLVFIIFLLTDQRHGRQCAGAVCVCLCTDERHGRQVVGHTSVGNTTHLLLATQHTY